MFGGRIVDGKIEYRDHSENFPKEGFFEHENPEVVKFIMEDRKMLQTDCIGEYGFSKEKPGHIEKWSPETGEKYNSLYSANAARIEYWENFEGHLSPFDQEVVMILTTGLSMKDLEKIDTDPVEGGVIID